MTHMLPMESSGGAHAQARNIGARLSGRAASYLKTTPLAQWHREKLQIAEEGIIARAKERGLRLARALAINSSDYEIYDRSGKFLRRGSLASMRYFAENYQGN